MVVHVMCDGDIYDLTAHQLTIHHPKVIPTA